MVDVLAFQVDLFGFLSEVFSMDSIEMIVVGLFGVCAIYQ